MNIILLHVGCYIRDGARLLAAELVDQGLTVGPRDEGPDHVGVIHSWKLVALLREALAVVAEGFPGPLPAALEVPRIARPGVGTLEVAYEDGAEVRPIPNATSWQILEPCTRRVGQENGKVLNDEQVIIRTPDATGEAVVLQPYAGVCVTRVLGDVGRSPETRWE